MCLTGGSHLEALNWHFEDVGLTQGADEVRDAGAVGLTQPVSAKAVAIGLQEAPMTRISCKRYRFPPAVNQHAVWLYFRFTLSPRDVEEMLEHRGIDVS